MAAHSDGDECINCGDQWVPKGKKKDSGWKRYSVTRIVNKSREIREMLTELLDVSTSQLSLSNSSLSVENRFLCYDCFSHLDKIERRQLDIVKKKEELESLKQNFIERTKQGTYLSGKLKTAAKRKVGPVPVSLVKHVKTPTVKTPPRVKVFRKDETPVSALSVHVPASRPTGLSSIVGTLPQSNPSTIIILPTGTAPAPLPTPDSPVHTCTCTKKKKRCTGFVPAVVDKIERKDYGAALRLLLRQSDRARREFLSVLCSLVRKEMAKYMSNSNYTSQLLTMEVVENFAWGTFFKETKYHLPIIHTVMESAVTTRNSTDKVSVDADGCIGPSVPGISLVMSVLLHLRRQKRFRMVQSLIGAQLYKHGCPQKLQEWFQTAGLCLSTTGTRNVINRLMKSCDEDTSLMGANPELSEPQEDTASSEEEPDEEADDMEESDAEVVSEIRPPHMFGSQVNADQAEMVTSTSASTSRKRPLKQQPKLTKKKRVNRKEEASLVPAEGVTDMGTEVDSFSKYVSHSVKKFDQRTQAMVRNKIQNIIFQAEMGNVATDRDQTFFQHGAAQPINTPTEFEMEVVAIDHDHSFYQHAAAQPIDTPIQFEIENVAIDHDHTFYKHQASQPIDSPTQSESSNSDDMNL